MAVAFGGTQSATPATGSTFTSGSFSISGSNLVIVVHIACDSLTATVSSVSHTFGGGSASLVKSDRSSTSHVEEWVITAPNAGSGTYTVNFSASVPYQISADWFTGSDQTTPCPTGDAVSATGIFSATQNVTLTPTNLTANDASTGSQANTINGDAGSGFVTPNQTFFNDTTSINFESGYNLGTTGVTYKTTYPGGPPMDLTTVTVRVVAAAAAANPPPTQPIEQPPNPLRVIPGLLSGPLPQLAGILPPYPVYLDQPLRLARYIPELLSTPFPAATFPRPPAIPNSIDVPPRIPRFIPDIPTTSPIQSTFAARPPNPVQLDPNPPPYKRVPDFDWIYIPRSEPSLPPPVPRYNQFLDVPLRLARLIPDLLSAPMPSFSTPVPAPPPYIDFPPRLPRVIPDTNSGPLPAASLPIPPFPSAVDIPPRLARLIPELLSGPLPIAFLPRPPQPPSIDPPPRVPRAIPEMQGIPIVLAIYGARPPYPIFYELPPPQFRRLADYNMTNGSLAMIYVPPVAGTAVPLLALVGVGL